MTSRRRHMEDLILVDHRVHIFLLIHSCSAISTILKMQYSLQLLLFAIPFINALPQSTAAGPDTLSTGNLGLSTTQNGLTDGEGCKAMTVIFARGTTETGNVGTLTGPPFFTALAQVVGTLNLAVQGVDYPADIPGFLAGGDATGSTTMAQLVTQAMTQCPNTKVVMSGYRYGYLYISWKAPTNCMVLAVVKEDSSFIMQPRC